MMTMMIIQEILPFWAHVCGGGLRPPDFLRAQCPQHIGGKANVSSLDDISG
jgi:hypothetical protein